MQPSIKLGKIFGIEVGLHYTWFIIAALITISLSNLFSAMHPTWGALLTFLVAATTAVMFFVTLLLHELSHCVVARAFGVPVQSVTLFALGGVSNIDKEASSAAAEFWMGVVGPITSLVIGFLCISGAIILGWNVSEVGTTSPIASGLAWLGQINIMLALFNLVPGFPLDGGRVLKAIIWSITGDAQRSALIAAYVGQAVALFLIIGGFTLVFATRTFGGVWLALVGWFLSTAATGAVIQSRLRSSLKDLRAADAMSDEWPTVSAEAPLDEFVHTQLAVTGHRYFLVHQVEDPQSIIGLVTPHEVSRVEHHDWPRTKVKEIMVPMESVRTTSPNAPIVEALETMVKENVEQLPVVEERKVIGILTRSNIIELFETRTELGLRSA